MNRSYAEGRALRTGPRGIGAGGVAGRFWGLFFCACFLLVSSATSWAQVTTATLGGSVTDPTGAITPGARVTVTHQETGATSTKVAGADGDFQFDFLRVGTYNITIEAQGFKRYE